MASVPLAHSRSLLANHFLRNDTQAFEWTPLGSVFQFIEATEGSEMRGYPLRACPHTFVARISTLAGQSGKFAALTRQLC
jgi:hypothetical protein